MANSRASRTNASPPNLRAPRARENVQSAPKILQTDVEKWAEILQRKDTETEFARDADKRKNEYISPPCCIPFQSTFLIFETLASPHGWYNGRSSKISG